MGPAGRGRETTGVKQVLREDGHGQLLGEFSLDGAPRCATGVLPTAAVAWGLLAQDDERTRARRGCAALSLRCLGDRV